MTGVFIRALDAAGAMAAGCFHTAEPVLYPDGAWSRDELKLLRADPAVEVVDELDAPAPEAPDPDANPLGPGGQLSHLTPSHVERFASLDRDWIDRLVAVTNLRDHQVDRLIEIEQDGVEALLFPPAPTIEARLDAAVEALRQASPEEVQAFAARIALDPEINVPDQDGPAAIGDLTPTMIVLAREAEPDAVREFLRAIGEDPEVAAKLEAPADASQAETKPAFADVLAQLAPEDFGRDGKPKVTALERVTGEDWNAARRNAAWAKHEASLPKA